MTMVRLWFCRSCRRFLMAPADQSMVFCSCTDPAQLTVPVYVSEIDHRDLTKLEGVKR